MNIPINHKKRNRFFSEVLGMVVRCNLITLAILGYLDLKKKWIPNVILLAWIATLIAISLLALTPINPSSILAALTIVGIFYPMRRMVECSAGDFKLYAIIMLASEPEDSLCICLISMILSLIPLASGIKIVPIALMTFFGYITFLLLRLGEIL